MLSKFIERDRKIYWTRHSREKMRQYQLSESRLKRILRNPERKEIGIAPGTTAVMQSTGAKKSPKEIWVMYQVINSQLTTHNLQPNKIRMISAWRYPGRSPIGKPPIPDDILEELNNLSSS